MGTVIFSVTRSSPSPKRRRRPDARIERGKYLVERVALCADCHTERDWKGKPDRGTLAAGRSARLQAGEDHAVGVPSAPAHRRPADVATDEQAVKILQTAPQSGRQTIVTPHAAVSPRAGRTRRQCRLSAFAQNQS